MDNLTPAGADRALWIGVLFQHTPNILFIKDLEGRYVDVNPAFETMTRVQRGQALGRTDAELFPAANAAQFRRDDLAVIDSGEPMVFEERIDFIEGPATSLTHKFPIRDDSGAIIAIGGVMMDISERRRIDAQLESYVMRQRLMLATMPAVLWSTNANLELTSVEGRALRLMNPDAALAIGQPIASLLRPGAPGLAAHRRALAGETVTYEVVYGGREFTCSVAPMQDADGGIRGVAGVALDVSEERIARQQRDRYQEQLAQVSRRLVSMQEAERRVIAADLHDRVGQALSALGIQLTVLRSVVQPAPDAQAILQEAQQILDEAGAAVRGVLAELRPEALHEYGLGGALRNFESLAPRRYGFTLSLDAPDEDLRLPAAVEAALYRIFQEAVANAARHASATRMEVTFVGSSRGAVLRIRDNGRGFRLAELQEPEKLSRWGLLMMRERADSIGARLRVSSAPGRGTSIRVSWRERRADTRPAR